METVETETPMEPKVMKEPAETGSAASVRVKPSGDMAVISVAKDLCSYILTVTDSSPKKFRFTLVSRLQGYSLSIIENLIRANEVYMNVSGAQSAADALARRRSHQKDAMTDMKLLAYMSQVAMERKCILPRQYEQITRKLYDCQNLLGAWVKSDARRYAPGSDA